MTFDGRTGMSLTWNDLGLVEKVSLNDTVLVNFPILQTVRRSVHMRKHRSERSRDKQWV